MFLCGVANIGRLCVKYAPYLTIIVFNLYRHTLKRTSFRYQIVAQILQNFQEVCLEGALLFKRIPSNVSFRRKEDDNKLRPIRMTPRALLGVFLCRISERARNSAYDAASPLHKRQRLFGKVLRTNKCRTEKSRFCFYRPLGINKGECPVSNVQYSMKKLLILGYWTFLVRHWIFFFYRPQRGRHMQNFSLF
jgi:hypothetical protein